MLRLVRKQVAKNNSTLLAVARQSQLQNATGLGALSTSVHRLSKSFDGALPISEIPGPLKVPFLGNAFQFHKAGGFQKFNQAIMAFQKEYGKIFQLKFGHERLVCISDLNMIEDVYRNEGKYPRREKSFPAWDNFHKKRNLPVGVFVM